MATGGAKGIGALLVFYVSWINQNLTPLFWILLVLVALDLLMGAHKEGQQFAKLGSMALSLGVPSYVGSNFGNPELGKYLVAIMCLVYLQVVVPQLIAKVQSWKPKTPQTTAEQQALIDLIKKVESLEAAKAQEEFRKIGVEPTIIKDSPSTATPQTPTEAEGGK